MGDLRSGALGVALETEEHSDRGAVSGDTVSQVESGIRQ